MGGLTPIAIYFDGYHLYLDPQRDFFRKRPDLPIATKAQFQAHHKYLIRPMTLIRLHEDIYLLGWGDRLSTVS